MGETEEMASMKALVSDEAERAERRLTKQARMTTAFEGLLFVAYLCLMDFHERLHWLILIATLLTYGTIRSGLSNLSSKLDLTAQRVIKAVPVPGEDEDERL